MKRVIRGSQTIHPNNSKNNNSQSVKKLKIEWFFLFHYVSWWKTAFAFGLVHKATTRVLCCGATYLFFFPFFSPQHFLAVIHRKTWKRNTEMWKLIYYQYFIFRAHLEGLRRRVVGKLLFLGEPRRIWLSYGNNCLSNVYR